MTTIRPDQSDTARLLEFMQTSSKTKGRNAWTRKVANGEWGQIPFELTYRDSDQLATLIDGYKMAKVLIEMHSLADPPKSTITSAADISRSIFEIHRIEGRWLGTAAELWVALFFSKRADHFRVNMDNDDTNDILDGLCKALRTALIEGRIWPPNKASLA